VIVLSPGTLTTAVNIPSAAPASGSYSAILVDSNGNQVGVGVVPEPATVSLLVFGVLFCLRRCRRSTTCNSAMSARFV
jgi:hypothetical protein